MKSYKVLKNCMHRSFLKASFVALSLFVLLYCGIHNPNKFHPQTLLQINFNDEYSEKAQYESSLTDACSEHCASVQTLCPPKPPNLIKKRLKINPKISLEEAEKKLAGTVVPGGSSYPKECVARWRIAIIVPYRDREEQIGPFLFHMHPFLQRQQLHYTIYFVNQTDERIFNRAKLLNVGFVEALKDGPFDCFLFHDVDLLPEDDRHLYHCSFMPRHLNVAASNYNYRPIYHLKYSLYFGGVCSMTTEHVKLVNGWSNNYWGWGGEDDDLRRRIALKKLHVWRYPKEIARYTMLPHNQSAMNPNRNKDLQKNIKKFAEDGLNSLHYTLLHRQKRPLYTVLQVDIDTY